MEIYMSDQLCPSPSEILFAPLSKACQALAQRTLLKIKLIPSFLQVSLTLNLYKLSKSNN